MFQNYRNNLEYIFIKWEHRKGHIDTKENGYIDEVLGIGWKEKDWEWDS